MIYKPTQEQLAEQFKKIPLELRRAIASSANGDTLFEIGKKHGLLMDKTGELAAETGLLMLGITHPNDFVGNLAERLQVDRQTASKIADDINREIFAPVREHLRAMFGIATQEETSPSNLQERSSALSAVGHQSTAPANNLPQQTTSLEDLEAELERALAEEKGIQPLSVVKKPVETLKPLAKPEPSYRGADPYREQVGEDLPNLRGKEYVPQNMEQKKNEIPPNLPFSKGGLEPKNPAFGFQSPALRTQPTATEEEHSPFSPLGRETPPAPTHTNRGALPAFRGFKMNNAASETKDTHKDLL